MSQPRFEPADLPRAERERLVSGAFPLIGEDLLREAVARATGLRAPAGERVVRQGESADRLFVVAAGEVDVVRRDPGGQEHHIALLGPGAYFGEIALLTGLLRTASVQARTDLVLLVLDAATFQMIVERSPGTAREIRRRSAERLGWTSERIYTLSRQLIEDIAQIRALYRDQQSAASADVLATCLDEALAGAVAARRLRDRLRSAGPHLEEVAPA